MLAEKTPPKYYDETVIWFFTLLLIVVGGLFVSQGIVFFLFYEPEIGAPVEFEDAD